MGRLYWESDAQQILIQELLPQTFILTPNGPEAEILSGMKISSLQDMKDAASKIKELGPKNVLIKGGHLDPSFDAIDILYDGNDFFEFKSERIDTKNTHGTGCTYSAAICAGLATGLPIMESVGEAKNYISYAIKNSFDLGKGHGPLNHFWKN